jgi:hypothetical protein
VTSRSVTLRGTSYPVVLPTLRDPRLHVAVVTLSVHVLGQVGLGFRLSVPQILAAILTCVVIEVAVTFRQTRSFVWPASAMLTGSGVALILRVVGTPLGDHWSTYAWYVYAGVAGLALLTKYVVRYHGLQVFNPSNIGLVLAFLVLGSERVEPLDFWWVPLDAWMIAAYAVIVVGGMLITRRLHLLAMAVTFWVTFTIGIGILAGSGHCMTANWAFAPVCGTDFVRVLATSPEVMIFVFFMVTEPRSVPASRVGRVVFAWLVAVMCTLLIAPQTTEFGTKVGLLAGLAVLCAARPILERVLPESRSAADGFGRFATRLVTGGNAGIGAFRRVARVGLIVAVVLSLGVGVVVAGTPARGQTAPDTAGLLAGVPHAIDPATLPSITVNVPAWDETIAAPIAQGILVTLGEDLELENQALLRRDGNLLVAVDHGDRLKEMQGRLADAVAAGRATVAHYRFDTVHVVVIAPFGVQTGGSIGFESTGTVTTETYDASGALLDRQAAPFALTFAVRRPLADRWMIVAVLPPGAGG